MGGYLFQWRQFWKEVYKRAGFTKLPLRKQGGRQKGKKRRRKKRRRMGGSSGE